MNYAVFLKLVGAFYDPVCVFFEKEIWIVFYELVCIFYELESVFKEPVKCRLVTSFLVF